MVAKLVGVERQTKTSVDTIEVSPDSVQEWRDPPFQRPLRINDKVKLLATKIKEDGGVIPGVITLGRLGPTTYLIDGQHRREAFILSVCDRGYCDVRTHHLDNMAQLGEEFVLLNSSLVILRPDDVLRGLEGVLPPLQKIRKACPYVGYDMIRRSETSPVVSMSLVVRTWSSSSKEVPGSGGRSAADTARQLTISEAEECARFLNCCLEAWGRHVEYHRLWASLTLGVAAWLYRRIVVAPHSTKTKLISRELFTKCLMSVSANGSYLDWCRSRKLSERDRAPCYNRLKKIFSQRLAEELKRKILLPSPAWAHS